MRVRAEGIERTRQRIVEAAVHLHGTLGPAKTTIAGVAERAGVTRLTVYRHFPDEEKLFGACSAHWLAGQSPPSPQSWAEIEDPRERLQAGLTDLYRFYRNGESMLSRIYRDRESLPEPHQHRLAVRDKHFVDVLVAPFGRGKARLRRSLVAHAISFWTWRSLCVENRLSDREAVETMTSLVAGS
jgi:AcrR family transcriptional regulator